jgi:hypothetical protein
MNARDFFPRFEGWRPLEISDSIARGDVFVNVSGDLAGFASPQTGEVAIRDNYGAIIGDYLSVHDLEDDAKVYWWCYRKIGPPSPRRIITDGRIVEPLPLP